MAISAINQHNNQMMNNFFHLQFPQIHLSHDNHHHHHHHHHEELKGIPKGCMAVMVGTQSEEQQRFVIPVMYINHPLFMQLLKGAEEEYGFRNVGPISIPCHVDDFIAVQGLIDKETDHHHHNNNHHHHSHHHNHIWCFGVWFHHHH